MGAESISSTDFESAVLNADVPVLVDFWAPWCGPCKAIAPILDQIAEEKGADAKVVKINVDESQDLAVKYQVRSIPTLLFFKGGEQKDQVVGGGTSKDDLVGKLDALA